MFSTVIITGASRGYGRAVAKTFARLTEGNMHFVLSGRSAPELSSLKDEIYAIRSDTSSRTHCEIILGDVGNTTELSTLADQLFSSQHFVQTDAAAQSVTFVNNAGSLGPITSVGSEAFTGAELAGVVNLNITGCFYLTSEFVRRVQATTFPANPHATVVNVSSLTAIVAAPSMSLYCAGKAARDMFHQVLAEEQRKKWSNSAPEESREIRVLNYAPGPMDTDMQSAIRTAEAVDASLGRAYTAMKETGQLVDVAKSAEKLVGLVRTPGAFVSGAHVDYYDETPALCSL